MEDIKAMFRKKLKPISKQDVTTLIHLPNDDHLEKLEQQHKEMLMAHKKVFQNVVTIQGRPSKSSKTAKKVKAKPKEEIKLTPEVKAIAPITAAEQGTKTGKTISRVDRNKKPSPVAAKVDRKGNVASTNRKLESLAVAIKNSNSGEDEVYSIIKEHLEYEMTGGAPKFRSRQQKSKSKSKNQRTPSGTSLLRSDAAGRALLKYDESHKKLQSLVDSFKEKVGPAPARGPSPTKVEASHAAKSSSSSNATTAPDVSDDEINEVSLHKRSPPVPLLATQEVLKDRKKTSREVTLTLSSSMKTIDRASSVAQRLGTLMSRVALRNEAYDYERQQEAEGERKSVSTSTPSHNYDLDKVDINNNFPTTSVKSVNLSTNHLNTANGFLTNNGPTILPKSRQTSKLSLQQPLRNNSISRLSVPPGVTKLDSSHFDKYVEEMKKVAQKAAESIERFKEKQVYNESELLSFSEGEDEQEDSEAAALVADYSQRGVSTKVSVPQTSHLSKQQNKVSSSASKLKSPEKMEMGTSPRQNASINSLINIKPRTSARDTGNNHLNAANDFLKNNDSAITPKSRQTSKLSLQQQQQPLRNNSIGRFNVPPGVAKLDSSQLSTSTKVPVPSALRQKQSSLEKMEMGTETAPRQTVSVNGLINSQARTSVRDIIKNKNKKDSPPGFEFAPGMSYTDQLMLQKLRKLKQQERWEAEFKLPEIMEGGPDKLQSGDRPGDVPHTEKDMQALLNRVKSLEVPKVEQPGIGALSLNAILRARMGK